MDDESWEKLQELVYRWTSDHRDHGTPIIKKLASWLGVLNEFEVSSLMCLYRSIYKFFS